ncbi:MAG: 4-hydroxythreonine-4-phosphate dehydrogenase PdxA [Aestuariivita sp.]|nr:4-hydroxythreonine-4-phosphate dehydrogenase PdxA [Aestuariivita sp.]
MSKAPIALTCGEPAGIGPELVVKAWHALKDDIPFFWIGDPRHLPSSVPRKIINTPNESKRAILDGIPIIQHDFTVDVVFGKPNILNAPCILDVIERGVNFVQIGEATALTTSPISKEILIEGAHFKFTGHTDYLASLTGINNVVMMLVGSDLRVVPATIHIPILEVPKALTADILRNTILITAHGLKQHFGFENPRIAVAGLNPHAGEGGKIGTEEVDWMKDFIKSFSHPYANLIGPLPADTMFHAKARLTYDAAIMMYHDQALIPIKTLSFDNAVNLTLGLPFIRTSPDHGTAFDIAGKGTASPNSLIEAIRLAWHLAN